MRKEINNKITEAIRSIQDIGQVKYDRPNPAKNKEYIKRLLVNKEALIYLMRDRKFSLKTIKHFELGLAENNFISIPIYKNEELIDWKFRSIPPAEKQFLRFPNSETYIFNEEGLREGKKAGEIFLVEGEGDCISLYENGFKNTISLVGGAQSVGNWITELDDIKKIYIALDSDQVGQEAARKLAEKIGIDKCINVVFPTKDANEFFLKYNAEDFGNLVNNSNKFPIEDVVDLNNFLDEIKKNKDDKKDFEFGYDNLQRASMGFNRDNIIVISGDTSVGKTATLVNLATKFCEKSYPVLYFPLEDRPIAIARKVFNILFGSHTSYFQEKDWNIVKKKLIDFPFYLYVGREKFNLEIFKKIIEIGKKLYNIEIFVLDHLQFITSRARDEVQETSYVMRELVQIARQYNITIFLIAHLVKFGKQDWTSMPPMDAIKSTGAIKQDAHMILMLWQNKIENEKANVFEKQNPILEIAIKKNREGPTTPFNKNLEFDFNLENGIISEHTEAAIPHNILDLKKASPQKDDSLTIGGEDAEGIFE